MTDPQGLDKLSERCQKNYHAKGSILAGGFEKCLENPYDKEHKNGIINLGTAQNLLVDDWTITELEKFNNIGKSEVRYFPDNGMKEFREELATFLHEVTKPENDEESDVEMNFQEVSVTNGCSSAFCALAYLIGESGDYYLFPTPSYGMVKDYMGNYMELKPYFVNMEKNKNTLTVKMLEEALEKAVKIEHKRVRGLVLINPNNPTGIAIDKDRMLKIMQFAKKNELHVVIDEIYFLSTYNYEKDDEFQSCLSYRKEWPDPERIHYMWGFSKDFAMSGLRCAVIYSKNKAVHEAFGKDIAAFHMVPGTVQMKLTHMFREKKPVREFLQKSRKRLKDQADVVTDQLEKLGLNYIPPKGTLFLWADFSSIFKEGKSNIDDEAKKIYNAMIDMKDGGICIPYAAGFNGINPTWFRIVYSINPDYLGVAMDRLETFVNEYKPPDGGVLAKQPAIWHIEHRRIH